jgi:iron complex outermembrane receptor protein
VSAPVLLLAFSLLGQIGLQAQGDTTGTASIAGVVQDISHSPLPQATIAVRNDASGAVKNASTEADGHFAVTGLPGGTYSVDVAVAGFATDTRSGVKLSPGTTLNIEIPMQVATVSQTITVEAAVTLAVEAAPSQSSLEARSAQSVISSTYIRNFIASTGDYSDVLQMSPGTFSVSPNGPGLGDTKTFFRGFKDGTYNMTFDGIPFNDTNDPTHHSWVWFPTPFIGSTVFDRSPGDATTIGPANAGGSVNLLSREATVDQDIQGTISYGSFNTRMLSLDYDSGLFGGASKKNSLLLNVHNLSSDGFQTYNRQNRWAGDAKYQYKFTDKTVLTAYTGVVDLSANTPSVKGPTRAQVAQFGNNYLLNNNPADPLYYKYNFYQVPTDFEYVDLNSQLGGGWKLDEKIYTNRYYNHQQYNNGTSITTTSATDKLNSYRKYGNNISASHESKWGTFRTGFWYERANTDRFQIPTDPRTFIDLLTSNFHEKFITQSATPFAQYEYHVTRKLMVTAGVKMSNYNMHLLQYADAKTIGCLGGTVKSGICSGGLDFITNTANYRAFQPTADARYWIKSNWSAYAQWATGNVIPPSSVFDTKNATVAVTPKPTQTKTFQFGTVLKTNRFTIDADMYFIHAQNAYNSVPDPTGDPIFFLGPDTHTKGFEVEGNAVLGHGLFLYANGTIGTSKYVGTNLWVASSPSNTETIGITYLHKGWDLGFFNKRVGKMWNDSAAGVNQYVPLDTINITNLFLNYTIKQASFFRGTKFRVGINNLFDQHTIVGVSTAGTTPTYTPLPGDFLTLMAGRSVSVAMTFGYAPKR